MQAAFFRFGNHRLHQFFAHFQAAPVLEHRHATDMAVGQQACGADRVIAFLGEKVHGVGILGVPLQFWRHRLLGDEHAVADTTKLDIVPVPVRDSDGDLTHRQIPGCLA